MTIDNISEKRKMLAAAFSLMEERMLFRPELALTSSFTSSLAASNPVLFVLASLAGNYGLATLFDKAEQYFKVNKTRIKLSLKQPFVQINNFHIHIKIDAKYVNQLNLNPRGVINHFLK